MSVFTQVTRPQLQALSRCGADEMRPLVAMLEETLHRTMDAMVHADDTVRIYRLQGRAEVLLDLLDAVRTAPDALSAMR